MKKILSLLIAGLLLVSFTACSDDEANDKNANQETVEMNYIEDEAKTGKFRYDVNEQGEYEIISYDPVSAEPIDELVLPSKVNERNIVGIAPGVFNGSTTIKSVVIPETYQYIGEAAFADCDLLTEITIPESVETLGKSVFYKCDNLEKVTLSSNITAIPDQVFYECKSLTSVNLENVKSIGKCAFACCSSLQKLSLSDELEYASKTAFVGCDKLTYTKDGGLLYLGNDANATLLLVAPEDLELSSCAVSATTKVVADEAFILCDNLNSITLSASIKSINGTAFSDCKDLNYTVSENGCYLGTVENPYMVLISLEMPLVEDFTLHKDAKIITDTAFEEATVLEDIGFAGTLAEWNAIIKSSEWSHDVDVNVTCSDGMIEN